MKLEKQQTIPETASPHSQKFNDKKLSKMIGKSSKLVLNICIHLLNPIFQVFYSFSWLMPEDGYNLCMS